MRYCWLFLIVIGVVSTSKTLIAQSYFASNALRWQGEPLSELSKEGFVLEITEESKHRRQQVLWNNNEPIEWFIQHTDAQQQVTRLQQLSAEGKVLHEWYYLYREDGSLWMRISVDKWLQFRGQGLWVWQGTAGPVIFRRTTTPFSFSDNKLTRAFVADGTLALQEEDFYNKKGELVRRRIYRYGTLFLEQFYTLEGRRIEIYYVAGYAVLRQVYQGHQLLTEEVIG